MRRLTDVATGNGRHVVDVGDGLGRSAGRIDTAPIERRLSQIPGSAARSAGRGVTCSDAAAFVSQGDDRRVRGIGDVAGRLIGGETDRGAHTADNAPPHWRPPRTTDTASRRRAMDATSAKSSRT